jgi:CheY-like chemotaxis protein
MRTNTIGWKLIDTPVTALLLSHDSMTSRARATAKERALILLVDDNQHGLAARKAVLEELGYAIVTAACGDDALEILASRKIHLVVTDYRMPRMNGVELIAQIRATEPAMPIILLSGFVEPLALCESSTGADIVLPKSAGEVGFLTRSVNRLLDGTARRKPPAVQKSLKSKSASNTG